jgi:isocitrate dehydrogenase
MASLPDPTKPNAITFSSGKIKVPPHPVIPFIEGDGIGPEIWKSTRQVVDHSIELAYQGKRQIQWKEVLAGEKSFQRNGSWLPEETIAAFKTYLVGIKSPLTTPVGQGRRSLNVALRIELDLYTNLRPIRYLAGAPSPIKEPADIDIVLFRENTEDVYTGIEFENGSKDATDVLTFLAQYFPDSYKKIGFPQSTALGIKPVSREGSERFLRTAIGWALHNQRSMLTIIHKGNIMKFTEGAFLNWGYELAEKEYSRQCFTMHQWHLIAGKNGEDAANEKLKEARNNHLLIINDMIVDAAFERAITQPQDFDVIATTNLNGDYLSDALAALVGGLGIAPGANINFDTGHAIFEAAHGTAPSIAGKGLANPSSLILSSVLLLRYIGWNTAANLLENGLRKTLGCHIVTPDFAARLPSSTQVDTSAFAREIIQRM